MLKSKFKVGDEVIFIKSILPTNISDKFVGTIGVIEDIKNHKFGITVNFDNGRIYNLDTSEITLVTKVTKVLYGL